MELALLLAIPTAGFIIALIIYKHQQRRVTRRDKWNI